MPSRESWVCAQSGACCRSAGAVTMTVGEWAAVRAVAPDVPVVVLDVRPGVVEVLAATGGDACAFYAAGCTVYPVRPGVCRAYGCFRRPGEAFAGMAGMIGRVQASAGVRRVAVRMVQDADVWTAAHG